MVDVDHALIQILTVLIATVIVLLCKRRTRKPPSNPNWFEDGWGEDDPDDESWGDWVVIDGEAFMGAR